MVEDDNIPNRLRVAMETVPFREADALLTKWKVNGSRISGTSASVGFAFRFRGVVIETMKMNVLFKIPRVRT